MNSQKIWVFLMVLFLASKNTTAFERPIAIVVASYNNNRLFQGRPLYEQNLESIIQQDYTHYRIIYIDDCSTDNTADVVEQYAQKHNFSDKLTLIRNTHRWGPSRNRYVGVHWCQDNEIVCILDGDDFFAHNNVLKQVNSTYENSNVWVTYSQFQTVPNNELSGGKPTPQWVINQHAYRKFGWYYHSLKTFYAWLFKKIRLKDLLYQGHFFAAASDLAEMFPLIEMSAGKFAYIPDILYYASQHPNNEMHTQGRQFMAQMGDIIMNHSIPYPPYKQLPQEDIYNWQDIPIYIDNSLALPSCFGNNKKYPFVAVVRSESDVEMFYKKLIPKIQNIISALCSTGACCIYLLKTDHVLVSDMALDISGVGELSPLYARYYAKKSAEQPLDSCWCSIYQCSQMQQLLDGIDYIELLLPLPV